MKEIKVSGCADCPFCFTDYNDFAVGFDSLDICGLAVFLKPENKYIRAYDGFKEYKNPKTPNWCPLKKGVLKIKLEELKDGNKRIYNKKCS